MMHKLMLWRPSAVPHGVGRMGAAACVCLILVTAACSGANADVEKAQIAVRANPDLELIATDDRQGVLTVGVKSSGQTITVEVRDVLSGTAFRNLATASAESRRTDQAAVATGELEFGGRGEYRRPQLAVGATGPLSFLSSHYWMDCAAPYRSQNGPGALVTEGNGRRPPESEFGECALELSNAGSGEATPGWRMFPPVLGLTPPRSTAASTGGCTPAM
jgi:hypothetical protein